MKTSLDKNSHNIAGGIWNSIKGYVYFIVIANIIALIVSAFTKCPTEQSAYVMKPTVAVIEPQQTIVPEDWSNYTINNAFVLSVPPTVELRHDYDKYTQQFKNLHLAVNNNAAVFQQKGLSNMKESSTSRYCRIMIQYFDGDYNDYYRFNETEPIEDCKDFLYEMAEAELGPSKFIGNPDYKWITIGNIKALQTSYKRTGYNGSAPVACHIFLLFNNKEMVKVIMSYRESEASIWKSDFEQIVKTFNWKKIY